MPFINRDGNNLYYEDSGGDGPAIVFSHGAFLDHSIWEPVVARLAPAHRCITWDARGHGMSDANGPFDYWDLAGDVVAILDEIGVGSAVLVGMSQGGWLTQRAALAHPDRVRAVVLTATSMHLLSAEEQAGYQQLADAWLAMGPVGEIGDTVLNIQFLPTDYDGSRYLHGWRQRPPAGWAQVWATVLGRDDIDARFSEIKCPGLCIQGTGDGIFPVALAEEMSSLLPDSRGVVAVEGGPHCISLTFPTEMSNTLRDFVAGLT
ncbi:MAG TPA: alpha/beta hydrolase [Acidimicrobiia bacterium]|nr:alpha/beta hydrolase [Acidimicrobiia bacterium]